MLAFGAVACTMIFLIALIMPVHAESLEIPPWIKQVALLWGSGQISDAEFVAALQYLVHVGILVVPEVEKIVSETDNARPAGIVHPDAKIGKITKIVDGDTVDIDAIRYRLSLIDTPERGEDGFMKATNALTELCPEGSTIYYDDDSIQGFDKYGRHLGVIWCEGNDYSTTAGEYLYDNGYLKKFYTAFCTTTEAASKDWVAATGNWFYRDVCY